MNSGLLERIGANGAPIPVTEAGQRAALMQGEPLHRAFRPNLPADYPAHMEQMAGEGAHILQLEDGGDICAIAVWRTYLTTYCGRRFEVDDLVTAEGQRSKGYGATLMRALEAKARALGCGAVMLTSGTWRVDAHRFYFRERFAISSFLFVKNLT
ncbi:MAG TPA: GNAT family N-acetyltransferase [Croceibacterium sp.]